MNPTVPLSCLVPLRVKLWMLGGAAIAVIVGMLLGIALFVQWLRCA